MGVRPRTLVANRILGLARSLLLIALMVVAAGAASCGGDGDQRRSLSVVTANMANGVDVNGLDWKQRMDRFAAAIDRTGVVPDIISMTESAGRWRCSVPPFRDARDYDIADQLLSNLRQRIGVGYRIAYMVGIEDTVNNFAGTPFCWFYSGDTLLYNPSRVTNLTPAEVSGKPQVAHNASGPLGFQTRRSLPLCNRGSNFEPLDELIDGPQENDGCNPPPPSGPAYTQVESTSGGDQALVASLARFSLVDVPGSSFDVVTTHPMSGEEDDHAGPINHFIAGLTSPPYRTTNPYYPVVVLGDFNALVAEDKNWPAETTKVFTTPADVMAVAIGSGVGLRPMHNLSLDLGMTLPTEEPCRDGQVQGTFSDHCALLVRFSES
jgi:hypothetical protein